jgi:methyltransferase (TIGR00027 family)
MENSRASLTALGAALMRAAHTRLGPSPLINDPWGDRIVLDAERTAVLSVVLKSLSPRDRERCERLGDSQTALDAALQLHPGYGWAVLRTRYAEDALAVAVLKGVRQYVIVGAGFDSFALRQPAFARDVDVFEIDHPATQELKIRRLHECGAYIPAALHFIAADLSIEPIGDALARSSFRPTDPTFFAWLGVTQYLTREANLATLRGIAAESSPGSQLVFTYVDHSELSAKPASGSAQLQASFAAAREPWISGFDPSMLREDLAATGFMLLEDLDGYAIKTHYCPGRRDVFPMGTSHIAKAGVR